VRGSKVSGHLVGEPTRLVACWTRPRTRKRTPWPWADGVRFRGWSSPLRRSGLADLRHRHVERSTVTTISRASSSRCLKTNRKTVSPTCSQGRFFRLARLAPRLS
jgi:hypothetical protein